MALQQLLQFSGRAKPLAVQPFEQPRLQLQRTVQQANLRPAPAGRLGQQHPHQPGGWVAQHPGRIEELLGGPGCDQQLQPLEITLNPMHRQGGCRLQQQARLHHPAAAAPITGQQTFRGRRQSQQRAITLQLLPIALHRRRFPHVGVHRCRREHWGPGGHQRGGQQGVSQAMHQARQRAGTQRHQQHQIRPLSQLDMKRPGLVMAPLISVEIAAVTGQAGQGHRAHQFGPAG